MKTEKQIKDLSRAWKIRDKFNYALRRLPKHARVRAAYDALVFEVERSEEEYSSGPSRDAALMGFYEFLLDNRHKIHDAVIAVNAE